MTLSNNFHRLEARLQSQAGRVIGDFNTVEDGNTILVCLSGGKDSYTMLSVLTALQKRAPVNFKLIAMNLDQKRPGFPERVLPSYLKKLDAECVIIEADTYSTVKGKVPESKTTCSLCSRLRHGVICHMAKGLDANRIALDHRHDDIVNTFFLNMFFGGKMKSMPPKLATDNDDHTVIRPLTYYAEKNTASYAHAMEFPIIPCNLCGSQENLQREKAKEMLLEWEHRTPGHIDNVFASLWNVVPSHLADTDLFDFSGLTIGLAKIGEDAPFGQTAYDQAPLVFAGSHDDRIEFVRFERKPGDELAEQAMPGEAAIN